MRSGLGVSVLLATFTVGAWALPARADLIDPAEEACGEAETDCTVDGRDGVCKTQTCSKLDYGNPGPDGTPGTREYDCVRCVPGAQKAAPEPAPAPDAKEEPKPGDGAAAPPKADPEPQSTSKGTSCTVESAPTSALSLLLGLGLLGLALRRRR